MYKILYINLNRAPFPPSLKSCGLKNLMKLGVGKFFFKNTLEERPHEKSCSSSKYRARMAVSLKKIFSKELKSESCVNRIGNDQSEVKLSKPTFPYNFEDERASHANQKI